MKYKVIQGGFSTVYETTRQKPKYIDGALRKIFRENGNKAEPVGDLAEKLRADGYMKNKATEQNRIAYVKRRIGEKPGFVMDNRGRIRLAVPEIGEIDRFTAKRRCGSCDVSEYVVAIRKVLIEAGVPLSVKEIIKRTNISQRWVNWELTQIFARKKYGFVQCPPGSGNWGLEF